MSAAAPLLLPALLLGVVQGLTEFLPVSSTAHLVALPRLFGWNHPLLDSETFDVALHLGTLIALVTAFRSEWLPLARGLAAPRTADGRLAWNLVIATPPILVGGKLLERLVEGPLRTTSVVAVSLAAGAVVLAWADGRAARASRDLKADRLSWRAALAIGCAQVLALWPGISRSGATIAAGLFAGLPRREAARFSFLLGTPAIAAACLWKALHLPHLAPEDLAAMGAGVLASWLVGTWCLGWMLPYVARSGYRMFVIWRLALAALLLISLEWGFLR